MLHLLRRHRRVLSQHPPQVLHRGLFSVPLHVEDLHLILEINIPKLEFTLLVKKLDELRKSHPGLRGILLGFEQVPESRIVVLVDKIHANGVEVLLKLLERQRWRIQLIHVKRIEHLLVLVFEQFVDQGVRGPAVVHFLFLFLNINSFILHQSYLFRKF